MKNLQSVPEKKKQACKISGHVQSVNKKSHLKGYFLKFYFQKNVQNSKSIHILSMNMTLVHFQHSNLPKRLRTLIAFEESLRRQLLNISHVHARMFLKVLLHKCLIAA